MDPINVLTMFLFYIVLYNIALLYGTVGEIITEKSGSLNLGVEGTMAIGAIGGYLVGCAADSLFVAVLAAFFFAALCGLFFAFLTVTLQANQNVTGLTITTFGIGLYFVLGNAIGKNWPSYRAAERLYTAAQPIYIKGLTDIPVIGKMLFGQNPLVYLGVAIAILAGIYIKYTKAGLRMRAVGENPGAADAAGINVKLYKYLNIIIGSGVMGIGGLCMGLNLNGSFEGSTNWINGYGWISIALVIFVNWKPTAAIFGTFVFGFFTTLRVYGGPIAYAFPKAFGWLTAIPPQFYNALPFIITAAVLILNSMFKRKKNAAPSALGVNYYREDR